jgi:kexin
MKDTVVNKKVGTLTDWRIKLYGESIDPSIQGILPMPEEHEDDNHDVESTTGITSTTAVVNRPSSIIPITTGLPTRPSISKPTDSPSSSSPDDGPAGMLPTGKRAQVWVYGALALTLVFCASLAVYLWRKRRRARADNYEFSLVAGDLYDAFAGDGEDDDDTEAVGLVDEDEDEDEDDDDESLGGDGRRRDDEMSLIPKDQYRS